MADKPKREKKGNGRPSLYKPEYDELAAKFARFGHTNEDLAKYFEVHISSLERWLVEHDSFRRAIKDARDSSDVNIEDSLYARARGAKVKKTDIKVIDGRVVMTEYEEQLPPDPTSMIFWLRNRQRAKWSNKPEEEQQKEQGITINLIRHADD